VVCVAARRRGDEARVLCRAKSNIGPDDGGFAYRIELSEGAYGASYVTWGEQLHGAARELIADDPGAAANNGESAESWLRKLLGVGPVNASDIEAQAAHAGYAWRTLERIKRSMGVVSRKDAPDGGWRWSLPGTEDRQDRHVGDGGLGGVVEAPCAAPVEQGDG
jgi:putative DNA primase/helicase